MMNPGIKLRLTALGVAVGLVGVLISVIVLTLQQKAVATRAKLGEVDLESFRIADVFKEKLRHANDQMRRHSTSEDPAAWEEFLKASEELKVWIEAKESSLTAAREQDLLKQMAAIHHDYVEKATELHVRMVSDRTVGAALGEFNGFLEQARRFMDLSQDLGRTHFESRNELLAQTS